MNLFLGDVQVSGLPMQIFSRGNAPIPLATFLQLEKLHHYYRTGRLASQFCAVYESKKHDPKKTNDPVFEAGHTIGGRIELYQDFDAIAKAVISEKRKHGESFYLDPNGEELNLQFYYPTFVTSGPLVECYVGDGRPRYRRVHRIGFLLRTHINGKQREFRIDVVDEMGFKRLLGTVHKEMAQVAETIRSRRRAINDSLSWITKKLSRRKVDFQRSYVSGELELD